MPATIEPTDPRPRIVSEDGEHVLVGARCEACGYRLAVAAPRCPACGGSLTPARFGPGGQVWAHTTVHLALPGREPPYALAYVDLDDGPRVLAHVRGGAAAPPAVGDRVRLCGTTANGDVEVEVEDA